MSLSDNITDLVQDMQQILDDCNVELNKKFVNRAHTYSELPKQIEKVSLVDHLIAPNFTYTQHLDKYNIGTQYNIFPKWNYIENDLTNMMQNIAIQSYRTVVYNENNCVASTTLSSSSACLGLFRSAIPITVEAGQTVEIWFKCTITHSQYYSSTYPCYFGIDTRLLSSVGEYSFTLKENFYTSQNIHIVSSSLPAGEYYVYIQTGRIGFSIDEITFEVYNNGG